MAAAVVKARRRARAREGRGKGQARQRKLEIISALPQNPLFLLLSSFNHKRNTAIASRLLLLNKRAGEVLPSSFSSPHPSAYNQNQLTKKLEKIHSKIQIHTHTHSTHPLPTNQAFSVSRTADLRSLFRHLQILLSYPTHSIDRPLHQLVNCFQTCRLLSSSSLDRRDRPSRFSFLWAPVCIGLQVRRFASPHRKSRGR
jgi:hypothetical protein